MDSGGSIPIHRSAPRVSVQSHSSAPQLGEATPLRLPRWMPWTMKTGTASSPISIKHVSPASRTSWQTHHLSWGCSSLSIDTRIAQWHWWRLLRQPGTRLGLACPPRNAGADHVRRTAAGRHTALNLHRIPSRFERISHARPVNKLDPACGTDRAPRRRPAGVTRFYQETLDTWPAEVNDYVQNRLEARSSFRAHPITAPNSSFLTHRNGHQRERRR